MRQRSRGVMALAVLASLWGSSCRTLIQAQRLVPARNNIAHIEKIAFAGFTGFDPHEQTTADLLNEAIRRRLASNPFLRASAADYFEAREGYPKKLSWSEKWRRFGKEQSAEAVLGGEIDLAQVRGEGDAHLAAIVLVLRVIDTDTGKHLLGTRVIEKEEAVQDGELLPHLIETIAEKVIQQISPQVVQRTMEFQKTKRTADGLLLAEQGEWSGAISSWMQALQEAPGEHAAHFNLGAAHEFLGAYALSLEHYRQAHALKPGKPSIKAIHRLEALQDHEEIVITMPGSSAQPTAPTAPPETPSTEASSPTH